MLYSDSTPFCLYRVDSELSMIESQQCELEELLAQLETQINHTPTHSSLHADMQRTRT